MPVKYQCPRCERRFVDWGAEKLGFKCPDCAGEELIRLGIREDQILQPPKLKRRVKAVAPRVEEEDFSLAAVEFEAEDEEEPEEIEVPELGVPADDVEVPLGADYEEAVAPDEEDVELKVVAPDEEVIGELPPDLEFEGGDAAAFDGPIADFEEEH